jgi:acyl-coenzyme A synthetase/AMP-(fatty) acid ligase
LPLSSATSEVVTTFIKTRNINSQIGIQPGFISPRGSATLTLSGVTAKGGAMSVAADQDEVINCGGFTIRSAPIEDALLESPLVRECAVTAEADQSLGEGPVAYVVTGRDGHIDAVSALASAILPPYQRPRRIYVVPALPRNAPGKVVVRHWQR